MKRTLTITMAALGFIAMSACTRSTGGGSGHGGGSPQPIQQTPHTDATPLSNTPSELDAKSGKSSTDDKSPQVPAPVPIVPVKGPQTVPPRNSNNTTNNSPTNNAPTNHGSQTAPQQPHGPQTTAPSNGPQVVHYDPSGLTPDQIFNNSANQAPVSVGQPSDVTNGTSADPLYYSGSGQDSLRETLETSVNDAATSIPGDKTFAKHVYGGRFDVDWNTRAVVLDLTIKTANGPTAYRFNGSLDNRLYMHAGTKQLSVDTACMDLNGGCNTVYVKVQKLEGRNTRTAHMLIRQTEATLYTQADGFYLAKNIEFDRLLNVFVNTVHAAGQPNSVNKLRLRTSETINGQSSFRVEFGILNEQGYQESLNLTGPLVKPAADVDLQAPAQVLRSSSPMADTVRNVSLIKNDGRGDLQLAITVRKGSAEAQEDAMNITVARIHKPSRMLIVK